MTERIRTVAPPALPPLRDAGPAGRPRAGAHDAARLARLGLCLAALTLPVLGSVAADTVHRGSLSGASQAAARPTPSGRTAAPQASRSVPVLREAALAPRPRGADPVTAPTTAAGGLAGYRSGRRTPDLAEGCGGARVIDFAICLILAVTVVGLLLAAL